MKTVTSVGEASACVLDILSTGRMSAGNVTRKMMGAGLLPNAAESYSLIAVTLAALAAKGLVEKHGNGKSVHWGLTPPTSARFTGEKP